jgi:hypothetical protein
MANIGAYAAKNFLDYNFGAPPTAPTSRFVGLTTGNPTSLAMSEMTSGDGYVRQSLSMGAAASPAGSCSNAAAMTFGSPNFVSSRVVSGLIISDSVSIAGGNLWWYGTPLVVRTPLSGDTVVIAVGGLICSLA